MSIPSSLLISLLVPTAVPALHGSLLNSVWVCLLQNCIQSHRAAHVVLLLPLHLTGHLWEPHVSLCLGVVCSFSLLHCVPSCRCTKRLFRSCGEDDLRKEETNLQAERWWELRAGWGGCSIAVLSRRAPLLCPQKPDWKVMFSVGAEVNSGQKSWWSMGQEDTVRDVHWLPRDCWMQTGAPRPALGWQVAPAVEIPSSYRLPPGLHSRGGRWHWGQWGPKSLYSNLALPFIDNPTPSPLKLTTVSSSIKWR